MITEIKFEDIDPSFLDFKPSKNLPVEVQENFYFHFNRQRLKYTSYKTTESDFHVKVDLWDVYWGAKFIRAFSHDCEDVWQSLYNNDEEATIKFSKYISMIGFNTKMNKGSVENFNAKVEYISSLKEKFEECLDLLCCYGLQLTDDGGWDFYDEESRNRCIQDEMHDNLKENMEDYIKRLEFIEKNRNTESERERIKRVYPISRKRSIDNAEAIFFIKILHKTILFYFKKPYHDHVATFINAVFDTCYDYAAIAQIVRKR